jgi:hypothetical protein
MSDEQATKKPEMTASEQQMLNDLHPMQRRIVENVMENHPDLTVAEAIEDCRAGGM